MSDSKEYLGMNLRDLRKLCIKKKLSNITNGSDRQQCINALLLHASKSPSRNRRRSLPNSRHESRYNSHSHSPKRNRINSNQSTRTKSKRRSKKRSRTELGSDNDDDKSLSNNEQRRKRRRKTNTPSTMSLVISIYKLMSITNK